jgi:biopolymer transport protein ExbD/biopolymer transport protein TolR
MAFQTKNGGTRSSLSEINVTPMVDVMLVLLIIFMVTAPILQTGIEVNLPRTRTVAEVNPEQRAVVTIGRGDVLYYRAQPVFFDQLGEQLQQDVGDSSERIFLQADEDVRWKTVATVIDEIRQSGYDAVSLVTKPVQASGDEE